MDFETSREAQNSTNAVGHVNLVEVTFFCIQNLAREADKELQ
jgi:hypothetical protein